MMMDLNKTLQPIQHAPQMKSHMNYCVSGNLASISLTYIPNMADLLKGNDTYGVRLNGALWTITRSGVNPIGDKERHGTSMDVNEDHSRCLYQATIW